MTDIYFRTDGNSEIATGHLMRCLTIARACVRKNAHASFVVSDRTSLDLLRERFTAPDEFDVFCLDSDYTDLQDEPSILANLLLKDGVTNKERKSWIFVDSYYATPSYLLTLRAHFRVAYLDDLKTFDCPVDLVINYDTEQDCRCYDSAAHKLLGIQYTPLREQFRSVSYTVRPSAEHVLLSTGGTDPYAMAEHLLLAIRQEPAAEHLRSLHYHVLTGNANARLDALTALSEVYPTLHIHKNVRDVATLMASCDLAVCAGGTTLCELCAVGVPTVSYLMAQNQQTAVETYAQSGLVPYAGDIRPAACPTVHPTVSQTARPTIHPTVSQAVRPTIHPTVSQAACPTICPTVHPASFQANHSPDFAELPAINTGTLSGILSFLTCMSQNISLRTEKSQAMKAFSGGCGADKIAHALTSIS